MRIAVLCKDHIGGLVQEDVEREVEAGGRKPLRNPIPKMGKMRPGAI